MHSHNLADWVHQHRFDAGNPTAEVGTRRVMWITAVMMFVEIAAGWWFNSMALLADGWHMSSHTLAIGLSAFSYAAARRYASDPRFAFGTWKIEVLGGFASAILLLAIAMMMVAGSIERLLSPQTIHYQEALLVSILGLVVNLVCAGILGHAGNHSHDSHHPPGEHDHHHQHDGDLNLKSAYIHVITDAATSVLAILALTGGLIYGWSWLDPVMGIVGAVLVASWAKNLIIDTGKVLLDREMDAPVVQEIRDAISENPETDITDLHVWRVGKMAYSCAVSVLTHDDTLTANRIRQQLSIHDEIVHVTVEINRCT